MILSGATVDLLQIQNPNGSKNSQYRDSLLTLFAGRGLFYISGLWEFLAAMATEKN